MKFVKLNLVQNAASLAWCSSSNTCYRIYFQNFLNNLNIYVYMSSLPAPPVLSLQSLHDNNWKTMLKYYAYPPRPLSLDRYFGWKLGIKHRIGHLARPEEPPTNFTAPINCSPARSRVLSTQKGHDIQKSGQTCAHQPFSCLFPPSRFGSCICPYCSNEARCSCACHFFLDVSERWDAGTFGISHLRGGVKAYNILQYQPHKVVFHIICHVSYELNPQEVFLTSDHSLA